MRCTAMLVGRGLCHVMYCDASRKGIVSCGVL